MMIFSYDAFDDAAAGRYLDIRLHSTRRALLPLGFNAANTHFHFEGYLYF